MRRKRVTNTEEFIAVALHVHGEKYGYENSKYIGSKSPVTLRCKTHGMFEMRAGNHLSGKGCARCACEHRADKKRDSREDFIRKSQNVHGQRYDYSSTVYVNDSTKVSIMCPCHGTFHITPDSHKRGSKCNDCANEERRSKHIDTLEQFLEKAKDVHGHKYDYSQVYQYLGNKVKVPILCQRHGVFYQEPDRHKAGGGCPVCQPGGYDPSQQGHMYVLTSGNITKVGVTNKNPSIRAKHISNVSEIPFEISYEELFLDGKSAWVVERAALGWLRAKYKKVAKNFNGSTECFVDVDRDELFGLILPLIQREKACLQTSHQLP